VEAYRLHLLGAMTEITTRIQRDELLRLLDTMTPAAQQSITTRASLSDIQAELARLGNAEPAANEVAPPLLFSGIDWDDLLTTAMSALVAPAPKLAFPRPIVAPAPAVPGPRRRHPRPFSHVAALLPLVPVGERRLKRPPLLTRDTAPLRTLALNAPRPPRTVAEVRERLESGDVIPTRPITASDDVIREALSPQVVSELSTEEIAMLPDKVRNSLVPTPPPIVTRAPETAAPERPRIIMLVASFALSFLAALSAAYLLV
jgi:hypothetical protein